MNDTAPPQSALSLVLPVYNEQESIPALVERLARLRDGLSDMTLEVILVDDHSTDDTQAMLREACKRESWMRYYRLAQHSGAHVAILAGLAEARGDCSAFLAADLQDPPELIPTMLEHWRNGSHIVWATRSERKGISLAERFFSWLYYWLMDRFSSVTYPPKGSDFALLDRKVADALLESMGANPSLGGEIARLGFVQSQVPYVKQARQCGRSKWTLGKKLKAFVDALVAFSYVPMRAMTYLGFVVSGLALLYALAVVVLRFLVKAPVSGWASTIVILLALGGIQMTMLGVLGEYLWRTLEESRQRPTWFIEDQIPPADEPERHVPNDA